MQYFHDKIYISQRYVLYLYIQVYIFSKLAITEHEKSEREKKIDSHIDRYTYLVTHTDEVASWMYMKSQESDTILTYG